MATRSSLVASAALAASCSPPLGAATKAKRPPRRATAQETIAQPSVRGLPVAPESQRVDLSVPRFSDPTNVTNPLFPVSRQESVLLLGRVDGQPFRTEVTLLPETRIIEWQGQPVETLVSQYVAYLGGRIHEVAYDFYAQDDAGAVWYFGEDVFNFKDGAHRRHARHLDRRQGRPGGDDHARRPPGRRRLPAREHPGLRVRGGHRQGRRPDPRRPARARWRAGSRSRSSTWTGRRRRRPSGPATASSSPRAAVTSRRSRWRCRLTRSRSRRRRSSSRWRARRGRRLRRGRSG